MQTENLMEPFFKLIKRAPFNIAPKRGEELGKDIFGDGKWSINESRTEANFYADPADRKLHAPYAGLAVGALRYDQPSGPNF